MSAAMGGLVGLAYFLLIGFTGQVLWVRLLGRKFGRALAVPLTLSVLVVVGSLALSTEAATRWPSMLAIIVGLGWLVNLRVSFKAGRVERGHRPPAAHLILIAAVAAVVLMSSYWDALTHLGPAQVDTISHLENLRTLQTGPLLTQYPVGHYALLQPLSYLMSEQALYRFAGPAFGVLSAVGFYLIARLFVPLPWALAATALLSSAAMNPLSLIRSSLLPSALSLLLILGLVAVTFAFVGIESHPGMTRWTALSSFALMTAALGLAAPYSLFSLDFALGPWLLVATAAGWITFRRSLPLMLMAGVGPGLWPLFRVLRPHVSVVGTTSTSASGLSLSSVAAAVPAAPLKGGATNSVASIVKELFEVFGLRSPFESVASFGAYLVVATAVAAIVVGWRRSSRSLVGVAFLVVAYGVFTQTGFSELLTYRGRSGWYFSMFAALLAVVVIVVVRDGWPRLLSGRSWTALPVAVALVSAVSTLVAPPAADRPYTDAMFTGVSLVAGDLGGIEVVADTAELVFLDGVDRVTPWRQVDGCPTADEVAVLDFSPPPSKRYLLQAVIEEGDLDAYRARELERVSDLGARAQEIDVLLDSCGFERVFFEDDVGVYVVIEA